MSAPSNPAEAAICPQGITAGNCGCTVDTANVQTLFDQAVSTRLMPWPLPDPSWAQCSGQNVASAAQPAKIASAAGKVGATGVAAAAATGAIAGSAVPVIGTIIGAIAGIFSSIFGHHAQAVAAQNNALCAGIPAINAQLQQVDAGLAAGSITPAQALSLYQSLQSQFSAAMKSGTSYKKCDALYACDLAMQMLIWQRTQDLQNGVLTSGAAAPWTASGATSAASSSNLIWFLAAGAALALLL